MVSEQGGIVKIQMMYEASAAMRTQRMHGIPVVGFGPGHEDQAHAPNELTWKSELVQAAAMYAAIPAHYCERLK